MNLRPLRFALGVCALGIAAPCTAYSEPLVPTNVAFDFELDRNADGAICRLLVMFNNLPRPESGILELVAGDGAMYGFSLAIADVKFANKLPAGVDSVRIESANIVAGSFATLGRLNGTATERGGYIALAVTEEDVSGLLHAFAVGDYTIEFRRAGSAATRAYRISSLPPPDVMQRWIACARARSLKN